MKPAMYIITFLFLTGFINFTGIHEFSINTISGDSQSLRNYEGKKIMIVILPATQSSDDSAYLNRLDSLSKSTHDILKIVCIPSYEDGFSAENSSILYDWYQSSLDSNILIAQAMYTHRTTLEQDKLFNWLTYAELNGHFDEDVLGSGQMYFINETGDLYGVFNPESKWSNKLINRMLQ